MFGWGRRPQRAARLPGEVSSEQRTWSARPAVLTKVQRAEQRKTRGTSARFDYLAASLHGQPAAVRLNGPQAQRALATDAPASLMAMLDTEGHLRRQGEPQS